MRSIVAACPNSHVIAFSDGVCREVDYDDVVTCIDVDGLFCRKADHRVVANLGHRRMENVQTP